MDGDRCLRQASLRPLTGREEDWLAQSRNLPHAVKVTRLLSECVLSIEGAPVNPSTYVKVSGATFNLAGYR